MKCEVKVGIKMIRCKNEATCIAHYPDNSTRHYCSYHKTRYKIKNVTMVEVKNE